MTRKNSKPEAQSKQAEKKRKAAQKPKPAKQGGKQGESKPPKKDTSKHRNRHSWAKGQSGNPDGRPKKGNAWTDIINEMMEAKDVHVSYDTLDASGNKIRKEMQFAAVGTKRNIRQLLALTMMKKALDGEASFMKMLMEHEVGKAPVLNLNANMTPEDLPELKEGDDPIAALLARFTQG